jgi:hypothetical protein
MASYERSTPMTAKEVFALADEVLGERGGVTRDHESRHSVTYKGAEGTVTLESHRHGPANMVVARTNQLRTSKLDKAVRDLMNRLPYQPDDTVHRPGVQVG